MKIRTDFVTNSSSSCFIIAFKGIPKIDDETLKRYPFLSQYQKIINNAIFGSDDCYYETGETNVCKNDAELQMFLYEQYGYCEKSFKTLYENDEYVRGIYDDAVKKIDEGYSILIKDVAYDDFRNGLFHELESSDFQLLRSDND